MAKLVATAATLLVRDLVGAAEHFRDAMGFSIGKLWGDPPMFTQIRRDGLQVMLKQADRPEDVVPRWTVSSGLWDVYFYVDDVDALFEEFTQRGAKIDYGLCDQPYGCREFGTQDRDGHDIGFGQVIG